ncbi:hypothetical protein RZN05_16635 [Sphingomonas sp. HF-S4]|uniref:Alkaline proteinase inhibitor/ Outer membrane lipoprotein Omp19 domain-containing protein n=1 Tax=Sphingomonas agrestis TaxID=3080540 RepID=A0ABU3YBH8_9SPHN|nr:hypothetical protein [Sphingomonas sp. HF-S4]MDV3458627.1 hypothetical protein [Sphingomonas sp. HF-S4]
MIRSVLAAAALATALPAAAQQSGSLWSRGFNQGITEYRTGQWDAPTGGALALSCLPSGQASIAAQIKGRAPPAGSALRLRVSSRAGSREWRFATDGQGSVKLAASSADFRGLWAALRSRDTVTIRYSDGRFSVQSLAGAGKTLPATPCG